MMKGVDAMADAVKVTLGPKGRHVLINKSRGSPKITKDGITVAKEIELEARFENIGAQTVMRAASEASNAAGDGTTTATGLARAIYREGAKRVAAGVNPMAIKRGMDMAVGLVVAELKMMSKPTKNKRDIVQVGTISANNDHAIGDVIAEAMEKVGREGVITVEEAKTMETTLAVVEGMQFDRGYLSPYFVTDPVKMTVRLEDPYILLHGRKISTMRDLLPILEQIVKTGKPILIMVEEVADDALAALEDIAILTGGRAITIAANAGFEGSVVLQPIMEGKGSFGFNAETGSYEDLTKGRYCGPYQGNPLCASKCRFLGRAAHHHRSDDCR